MYENKNDKHNKQVSFKNEQECQKAGGAKADDYDIFIDIKKSYETALGKYVHQVGQLKAELREERLKRIRFETMANEIKGREKKVLDEINLKHNSELKLLIDKERASIYKQFKQQLESFEEKNKTLSAKLLHQDSLVSKMSKMILESERLSVENRFTFYQMAQKDTFLQPFVPTHGKTFELLSKCQLQENVDFLHDYAAQMLKHRMTVQDALNSTIYQIKQVYDHYMFTNKVLDREASVIDRYAREKVAYNETIGYLQDGIKAIMDTSLIILRQGNETEVVNRTLKEKLKKLN